MRLLPLIALTACVATVDVPFDGDQDGLLDDGEERAGTDPTNPDSDADGFLDGEEVDQHTDPLSPDDHPYTGGWAIGACRDEPREATGDRPGQITADFALIDQFGDEVHLYDFCDRHVLLVSSALWCGACQAEAPHLVQEFEALRDRGLMIITLIGEDNGGQPSTPEDAAAWAEMFGIPHPVVTDSGWPVTYRFVEGTWNLPSLHWLRPGAEVAAVQVDAPDFDWAALEAELPE